MINKLRMLATYGERDVQEATVATVVEHLMWVHFPRTMPLEMRQAVAAAERRRGGAPF